MPNFRYRALTQAGEIVNGTISAPTAAEVARRDLMGLWRQVFAEMSAEHAEAEIDNAVDHKQPGEEEMPATSGGKILE